MPTPWTNLLLLCTSLCIAPLSLSAEETGPNKVLLLNSYHKEFRWTEDITRGVQDTFAPHEAQLDLHVDYMDTKRQFSDEYMDLLAALIKAKQAARQYDAVIFSDDNALNFALEYGHDIFGDIPFVFCGANYLSPDRLDGRTNMTGIVEEADIDSNLNLIHQLHPDCTAVTVVVDNTPTGKKIQEEARRLSQIWKDIFEIRLLYDVSGKELQEKLSQLKKGDVVLYSLFFRDKNSVFYEYDEAAAMVAKASPVPVYVLWDFALGYGAVGGHITTGYAQGQQAARQALQIFEGTAPRDIPIQTICADSLRFDHRALTRFGIRRKQLPKGAEILYMPRPFYQVHTARIWQAATIFALLIIALVGLGAGLGLSRRAATKLRRKEEDLRTALHSISDGVITTDMTGLITRMNTVAEQLTGYTQQEATGQPADQIFHLRGEVANSPIAHPVQTILAEHTEIRSEGILSADGTADRHITISAAPISNDAGTLTGTVVVMRDITQELARNEQLKHAQKMEAVGQLAGGIAHDFNNILQAILGFSELLLMTMDDSDELQKENIREIQSAAQHAADLTKQMLVFSRKEPASFEPTDLTRIVKSTTSFIESILGENIQLIIELCPDDLPIHADFRQIERAILNTALNARDAMPDGGSLTLQTARISFSKEAAAAHPEIRAGDFACLRITDTGTGMEQHVIDRIFEPFFSTKAPGKGTGLGLAAFYGIIQEHRGWVTVDSEIDEGTTFNVYLPLHDSPRPSAPQPRRAKAPFEKTGQGQHILLVEDDHAIRAMTHGVLTNAGYDISSAPDAETAEQIFHERNGNFSLLISDCILPKKSGAELADTLTGINQDLPVIICSGYSGDRVNRATLEQKGFTFLEKPYSLETLLNLVKQAHSAPAG